MAVAKAPSESSLPDRVVVRLIEAQEREEPGRRLHRVVNNARPPASLAEHEAMKAGPCSISSPGSPQPLPGQAINSSVGRGELWGRLRTPRRKGFKGE